MRRRKLALIDRARERTVRVLSASLVRLAKPIVISFLAPAAIFATPLASNDESDG